MSELLPRTTIVAKEERLFDLLQTAWGMSDPEFESLLQVRPGWMWLWANHYLTPSKSDLARIERLARFHDAMRLTGMGPSHYAKWWRRKWTVDSRLQGRAPLAVYVAEGDKLLDRLQQDFWAGT